MTIAQTAETGSATPTRDLRALPKGHLHLHMEAGIRPATLAELREAHGVPERDMTAYEGFTAFSAMYRTLLDVMPDDDSVSRLVDEIFEDSASDGVSWLELNVSPAFYAQRLGSLEAAIDMLIAESTAASRRHGVAFGLMVTADRTAGLAPAVELARAAAPYAGRGVVSMGLAAEERGFPAADFGPAFRIAKDAGLQITPHAGELVGPESVRGALDVLGADRVLHGVRSLEDPELIAELVRTGIPLDVCPTSNLVLVDSVTDLARHPIRELLDAGVRCSINADDPILFGPGILDEYVTCREVIGLSDEQLADCAWTSIETTLAPAEVKADARARIDAWLA
ncbi:adenosine deaminase [Microbacterium excoecariae]|uniref:adenosine deaminase n=1 Tax=Microbacterium excoecariae TaxID=2715210 RepID=UPI00140A195F|nr:adenosine deaminase [Microbacterium excoecariae]NHI16242.1 adenosine deaminase [Microbacterium excoecariae]